MKLAAVKGFRDIQAGEVLARRAVLEASCKVLENYGFEELELPLLERVELFQRTVGDTSDIVEKEMYTFEDRDGSTLALRPEGTASLVRAYLAAGMARSQPEGRFYYRGPMFRRERPQKGRFRQFSQIGAEMLGRSDPAADAEAVTLVADICEAVGLREYSVELNSLGDDACRPAYRKALAAWGEARIDSLCEDCRSRLQRNPLRLLDCKVESCREAMQGAPMMVDSLCDDCERHHGRVKELLTESGVEVTANPRMVRGLDYYCRTAFEVTAAGLGSQDAVGGGGRYDGLAASLGGPDIAGVGFAFGLERMVLAAAGQEPGAPPVDIVVAPLEERALGVVLGLARRLRRAGKRVEVESPSRSLKAQMKRADRSGAACVLLVGEAELEAGKATLRDMVNKADHAQLIELDGDAEQVIKCIGEAVKGGA